MAPSGDDGQASWEISGEGFYRSLGRSAGDSLRNRVARNAVVKQRVDRFAASPEGCVGSGEQAVDFAADGE